MLQFNPMRHRIPLLKRALPSLRKRLAAATWPGGFRILRRDGALFLLAHRNYVDRQIAFYGDFERAQRRCLFAAMAADGCDLFLDVGANIGFYSVLVASRRLAGRVVAVEPDRRSLDQIGANLLLNGLSDRVEVIPRAATAETGPVSFLPCPATSTGQSRLGSGPEAVTVAGTRLDDAVAVDGARIAVKIDVEGHEAAVIAGMPRLLARNRVLLQVECFLGNLGGLRDTLEAAGYRHLRRIDDDHYFANYPSAAG